MRKMVIYDPAMCCSTGVCGPSVNPELLRVSVAINTLKEKGIIVERYNLSSSPQAFISNPIINDMVRQQGVGVLPIIMVDGKVVKVNGYPSNKEFCEFLGISEDILKAKKVAAKKCNCKGGKC